MYIERGGHRVRNSLSLLSLLLQALMETDDKVGLVWKHQLMQFKNISEHQAAAIAAVYTSPAQLLRVQ